MGGAGPARRQRVSCVLTCVRVCLWGEAHTHTRIVWTLRWAVYVCVGKGVYVLGGFGGHGMPRCSGMAQALAETLVGSPVTEGAEFERCDLKRFAAQTLAEDELFVKTF